MDQLAGNGHFHPTPSLILSNNARPAKSVYLKFNSKSSASNNIFSYVNPWSVEILNSTIKSSSNIDRSMFLGMRVNFHLLNDLEFELLQTSQWGGNGYQNGLQGLKDAFISNSNEGKNAHINRMAGFGFKYTPQKLYDIQIYGQAIGEDEAGNLPSCFMHMFGILWNTSLGNKHLKLGLESIDTRIDTTKSGNCGPNTAYNNNTYTYTNYGTVMGAPIDTDGTSRMMNINLGISQNINLKYTLSDIVLNDYNSNNHRLATSRQNGYINAVNLSWKNRNITMGLSLSHQNLFLDQSKLNASASVSYKF